MDGADGRQLPAVRAIQEILVVEAYREVQRSTLSPYGATAQAATAVVHPLGHAGLSGA